MAKSDTTGPEALRERLAAGVRARRRRLKLTQEQAAERAAVTVGYWQRIEGRDANATLDVITRIAGALETTPAELFARRRRASARGHGRLGDAWTT